MKKISCLKRKYPAIKVLARKEFSERKLKIFPELEVEYPIITSSS